MQSIERASALARLVLPTPGTSSMSRWPSASRQSSASSMTSGLPWITRSMLRGIASNELGEARRRGARSGGRGLRRHEVSTLDARSPVGHGANGTVRGRATAGRSDSSRPGSVGLLAGGPSASASLCRTARPAAVLAVDIGGTKLAAGIVDGGRRRSSPQAAWPPTVRDAEAGCRAARRRRPRPTLGRAAWRRPVVCGVGCGGPMTPGGEAVSPLNIHGVAATSRCGRRLAEVDRASTCSSTTTPRRWRWARAGSAAPSGSRDYLAMVVSTGVGGGIVLDGRLLDGADGQRRPHRPRDRRARRRPPVRLRRARLPRGRGVGHRHRGDHRAAAGRGAARGRRRRTGTLVGRAVASVAALLDLRLAVVAGSVALGFGDAFFAAAQAEIDRCWPGSTTPPGAASARPGSAPTARSSAPPPSASRGLRPADPWLR